MENTVEWRDIPTFNGVYQVSNTGKIRNAVKGRELKGWVNDNGYQKVILKKGDGREEWRVHRLVALVFIPQIEGKPYVNHIDGNKLNNNVDNLEWCTFSENMLHAYRTGLIPSKKRTQAEEAVKMYTEGISGPKIAEHFDVKPSTIYFWLKTNGVKIRSASEAKSIYHIDQEELIKDFKNGMRNVDIAKKYNCSTGIVAVNKYNFKKRGIL